VKGMASDEKVLLKEKNVTLMNRVKKSFVVVVVRESLRGMVFARLFLKKFGTRRVIQGVGNGKREIAALNS
jgi:hypothetical protein